MTVDAGWRERLAALAALPETPAADALASFGWERRAVLVADLRAALAAASPREGGGDAGHPESVCGRCGGANPVWSAPSPLWNAVMRRQPDAPEPYGGIVCPACFAALAETAGIATRFRLDAKDAVGLSYEETPGGRVWDADRDLWVEPPAAPPSPVGGDAGALPTGACARCLHGIEQHPSRSEWESTCTDCRCPSWVSSQHVVHLTDGDDECLPGCPTCLGRAWRAQEYAPPTDADRKLLAELIADVAVAIEDDVALDRAATADAAGQVAFAAAKRVLLDNAECFIAEPTAPAGVQIGRTALIAAILSARWPSGDRIDSLSPVTAILIADALAPLLGGPGPNREGPCQ